MITLIRELIWFVRCWWADMKATEGMTSEQREQYFETRLKMMETELADRLNRHSTGRKT